MATTRFWSATVLLKLLGLGFLSLWMKPTPLATSSTQTSGVKIPTTENQATSETKTQSTLFTISTPPSVAFDQRYFLKTDDKLWQKNWNYQQKSVLDLNKTFLFKELLNLLNARQLDIIRKIAKKELVNNFIIAVNTTDDSLIKILFNRNPNNSTYLQIEQLIKFAKTWIDALKANQFKIDDDFKNRFATTDLASDELAKHFKKLFRVNDGSATFQKEIGAIQKIILDKLNELKKETLFSRQKVILTQLFQTYPEWFNGNDEIDLTDSWNQKWENEGGAKKSKINQLLDALQAKTTSLETIVNALKLHVEDIKPLVVKLSTDKKVLLTYTLGVGSVGIYNPIIYLEPNNQILPKEWINLIVDFIRYCFLTAQLTTNDNVLDAKWDLNKLNDAWKSKVTDMLYKTLNKILFHVRVKKVAIPAYFNNQAKTVLNVDEIGNLFTTTFSFVKDNFLEGELKKVVKKVPEELKKNIENILKYLKQARNFTFPSALQLAQSQYQTLIDQNLQKRIKGILQKNHSKLLALHQKIMQKQATAKTYFETYENEQLLMQKYQPFQNAETKYLLLLNIFDKKNFNDYQLLLKYVDQGWKIVYCDHSFAIKQLLEFLKTYRGHEIVNQNKLRYKFSSFKEAKEKIQLIKTYQIPFSKQFNLKGTDFDAQSEINLAKLNDDSFTNEERYSVLNNLNFKLLNEMIDTEVVKKLLIIKSREQSLSSAEKTVFFQFLKNEGIDSKVINTDDFKSYSFTQLNNILKFKIENYDKTLKLQSLKILLSSKKEIIKIAKLLPLNILQTTKVTLNDLDINGNISASKTAELLENDGLTTAEFEAIKLELNNAVTIQLASQTAAIKQALMHTNLFAKIQAQLQSQTSKWTTFLSAIGVASPTDIDSASKIYNRMKGLTSTEKEKLQLYAGMLKLNKLITANPLSNWNDYKYAFFAYSDIKSFFEEYEELNGEKYWWFNQANLGTAIQFLVLPKNDQSKRLGIQNYTISVLTTTDKAFLNRLYQSYTFDQNGEVQFNDSYRLTFEESYYYRTWNGWQEPGQ